MPFILEHHHHRLFGAIASMKAQFMRPEFLRLDHVNSYMRLPVEERDKAMTAALGPFPAVADFQGSRAADSEAMARADALRWLAYRKQRLNTDDAGAFRNLLSFWATELHKSLDSLDLPHAWRNTKAGEHVGEIRRISEAMVRRDRERQDYPEATWANASKLLDHAYELEQALDDLLLDAVGGAPRPVLTQ